MTATRIKEHMDVIGADGVHVGTVDRVEGARIKLTAARVRTRITTIIFQPRWSPMLRVTTFAIRPIRMSR